MKTKEKKERRPIRRRTWKILAIVLASILGLEALLAGGYVGYYLMEDYFYYRDYGGGGESDRLSSRNINQDLRRAPDWEQIVRDSPFQLGELLTQYGFDEWQTTYAYPDAAYPTIDGSTVMVAMGVEFARQHLGLDDEKALFFGDFHTTEDAYARLFNRFERVEYPYPYNIETYIHALSPRPLDLYLGTAPGEQELALAEKNGVTPVVRPVCWDAFVFITHRDNPVDSLALEQVRGIYSGAITNWKEAGGEDMPVAAYQREKGSGSQTGMEQLVMRGVPLSQAPSVEYYSSMMGLVEAVAEYQNGSASIGYTYRYYIENLYKNPDIKMLRIEGVAPTDENIVSGAYPLSVNYYGVIRAGEEDRPGGLFLDWILSEEGQACVKQAGYIPLK